MSIKKIIFRISVIILIVEFLIMFVLDSISFGLTSFQEMLLDAFILVLLSTPIIYFWVIKPYKITREQEQLYLFRNSRMVQMGELLSMIAHQWRQPLSAISTNALNTKVTIELEKYDLNNQSDREEFTRYILDHLNQIEMYVQSLSDTINDFRSFYKPDKKSSCMNMNASIEKAVHMVAELFLVQNIKVIEEYNSAVELEIFENEMMQVILNILKNAQDNFAERLIDAPRIMVKTHDVDDKVIVEIWDNGGGIPREIQEKIFDPYFSTKDDKNGTGLGLYMSKTIVEQHHYGRFSVHNRDGGACFVIELPLNIRS